MQTVFANQPLFHHWAHNPMDDIRNSGGSLFTSDGILYSYGTHYKMAKQYPQSDGMIVTLFNENTYSPTTGKQRGQAMSACSHHAIIQVPDVDPQTGRDHDLNAIWLLDQVRAGLSQYERARLHKAAGAAAASRARAAFRTYCDTFDITLEEPTDWLIEVDEIVAIAAEADRLAREVREAALADDLRDWAQCKRESVPGGSHAVAPRLRVHNNELQTSHGIRFTLTDAVREELAKVWQIVQGFKSGSAPGAFRPLEGVKVGTWTMNKVENTEGRTYLIAGCHRMAYPQIRRVARMMGFPQSMTLRSVA